MFILKMHSIENPFPVYISPVQFNTSVVKLTWSDYLRNRLWHWQGAVYNIHIEIQNGP